MAEGGSVDNSSDSTFDLLCTNCSDDGYDSEAVNYCIQCEIYFCSKCIKMHNRLPATKNHDLLDKDKLREGMEKKPMSELTAEDKPGDSIADIHCLEKLRVTDKHGEAACRPKITEKEKNSIKTSFLQHGVNGITRYIEKGLNQWKTVELNIAITGNSGAGKSSFINAIRGLTADDMSAAAVGVVETTKQPKKYLHPNNRNCVFWDLPGIGTENFKAETYLKDVQFETYDFFIILVSGRFTENDMMLAKNVHAQGKRCYLARTKIDVELNNDKKSHPKKFNRDALLLLMREDCLKIIKENNLPCQVYLIDNYNQHDFDFGLLLKDILESSFSLYREAFALSMSAVTDEVIEEKRNTILERVQLIITVYQILFGALNVFYLGLLHGVQIVETYAEKKLVDETNEFRVQFGLTGDDLENHAILLDMSVEDLKKKLHLSSLPDEMIYTKPILYRLKKFFVDSDSPYGLFPNSPSVINLPIFADIFLVKPKIQKLVAGFEALLNCMVEDAKTINRLKTAHLVEKPI